jgi:uroporphyrinogen III methyltransferase / synthase
LNREIHGQAVSSFMNFSKYNSQSMNNQRTSDPLLGLQVLNTRPHENPGPDELSTRLLSLGAEVLELPSFRLAPASDLEALDASIKRLAETAGRQPAYDWIFFTSANAVRYFMERIRQLDFDAGILAGAHIGAVGGATAAALSGYALQPDFVPERSTGGSLAGAVGDSAVGKRALLPRSEIGLPDLADELVHRGVQVDAVAAYRPVPVKPDEDGIQAVLAGQMDIAVFFSPSAVRGLQEMLVSAVGDVRAGEVVRGMPAACIGPTTAAAAEQAGMQVAVIPEEYSLDGLLDALIRWRAH